MADEMIINNIISFHQWLRKKNKNYPSEISRLRELAEEYIQESYYPENKRR